MSWVGRYEMYEQWWLLEPIAACLEIGHIGQTRGIGYWPRLVYNLATTVLSQL